MIEEFLHFLLTTAYGVLKQYDDLEVKRATVN